MKNMLLGVFVFAAITAPAFAADSKMTSSDGGSEVLFGSALNNNTQGNFRTAANPGLATSQTFTARLDLGYQRMVMPMLQLGIRGGFGIGVAAQAWNAMGWATWNFDEKINDAFFLGVGVGIVNNQGGFLDVGVGAEFGKRFELCPGLTYRPTVEAMKLLNGSLTSVAINFVGFSYVW
jgi:opacity protein-like surface antigen